MSKKMWRLLIMLCLSGCGLGVSFAGAQDAKPKPVYDQVLEKLESLQPTGKIQLEIGTEKEQYELEDPFEVRFMASQDCYVVLMDIGSAELGRNGEITFWLPNAKFPDNKITGGKVYSTLYDLGLKMKVGPPYGVETINIFCSAEKITLFETDFKGGKNYYTITPNDEERLAALLKNLEHLKSIAWAGESVKVHIGKGRALARKYGSLPPIQTTGTSGKFWPPIKTSGSTGISDHKSQP